jgi:hypothetical protein
VDCGGKDGCWTLRVIIFFLNKAQKLKIQNSKFKTNSKYKIQIYCVFLLWTIVSIVLKRQIRTGFLPGATLGFLTDFRRFKAKNFTDSF